MEQIKPNYFGGANFEARTVKDIIEPAKSISNKVSVRAALDQMQAQATRFVTCSRSMRRIIGHPVERQNEPERGSSRT